MLENDRRACLRLLGAVALAPLLVLPGRADAAAGARLALPSGDMILTRQVERELRDGKRLLVTRSWQCRFSASGGGAVVEGHQIGCHVDAPPQLASLALMEEEREDSGPFPAILDPLGRIASRTGSTPADLSRAIEEALRILTARGHSGEKLAESQRFLGQLAEMTGAAIGEVSADLFYPVQSTTGFSRVIDLPDATHGTIDVAIEVRVDRGTGLLERSARSVVTRIGSDSRHNSEVWTLTAL